MSVLPSISCMKMESLEPIYRGFRATSPEDTRHPTHKFPDPCGGRGLSIANNAASLSIATSQKQQKPNVLDFKGS